MVKIDLGCGYNKQPGYIGIDRFETPDTKIVCDFDKNIPLEDNTVDYIMASHSLEHASDLILTMEEIYRVCKHKAIVCIAAPYFNTSLNMANPFHKQVFNEHTARFFTSDPVTIISPDEYYFPHAVEWGLGASDNSNLRMDFRCLKMEFFYFPEYRFMDENDKVKLRRSTLNVVDQILIHLVVVKDQIEQSEILQLAQGPLEEPNHVTIRRLREKFEESEHKHEEIKLLYSEELKKAELTQKEISNLKLTTKKNDETLHGLIDDLKEEIRNLKDLTNRNQEVMLQQLDKRDLNNSLEEHNPISMPQLNEQKIHELWLQTVLNRYGKGQKLLNRLRRIRNSKHGDLVQFVNEACQDIVNHSIIHSEKNLENSILELSVPITTNEFIHYSVVPTHQNWMGIECIFTNYKEQIIGSQLAFEVLDENQNILRTVHLDGKSIKHNEPTSINFVPIKDSDSKVFYIRFMGVSPEVWGIHIYEWTSYTKMGAISNTSFAGKLL